MNLNRLAYFAAVAEAGSYSEAARQLGVTKALLSQQVMRLEEELRTALLLRTSRRLALTEAGRTLHARCAAILREVEDARAEIASAQSEPAGLLRVAAPNDYGTSRIAPLAARFSLAHPRCGIELLLSDERIDLAAGRVDLAVRVGWLEEPGLEGQRIGGFGQWLVAAPGLAAAASDPEALQALPFVANRALRDPLTWRFVHHRRGDRTVRMREVLAANATPAVLAATLAGGGVSVLPDFLVTEPVRDGRLVRLLPDWDLPSGGVHAVFPASRFRPPKVTAFVAMLAGEHAQDHGPKPGR
ncbi:LysR family transcriptional regulator [Muricoccus pecuniae]|uniref:DNA-binding transcriptional LysR family regulator n=1 Tax=Muricoccus pecuniae TaxID=693023 RepID=A0A840YCJ0_9PROT|nr:LysR family transcriptional regulator [Roseomonas pecuniae]MBB5696399.1 DNA-binding transcriptional LysR family regulator [Roseomonas pecuniae]